MADRENCAWESTIYERSGLIQVRRKATQINNEGRKILRGLVELCFINQRYQVDLKSMFCSEPSAMPFPPNICHVTLEPRPSLAFFPASEKRSGDEVIQVVP